MEGSFLKDLQIFGFNSNLAKDREQCKKQMQKGDVFYQGKFSHQADAERPDSTKEVKQLAPVQMILCQVQGAKKIKNSSQHYIRC